MFLMRDEQKVDLCGRIVRAGGGTVLSYYSSLEDLIRHASNSVLGLYKMVTHIFLDNVEEWCALPRFRFLVEKTEGKDIHFLYHKTHRGLGGGRGVVSYV